MPAYFGNYFGDYLGIYFGTSAAASAVTGKRLAVRVATDGSGKAVFARLEEWCDAPAAGDKLIGLVVGEEGGKPVIAFSRQACAMSGDGTKFEIGKRYFAKVVGTDASGKPILASTCKNCTDLPPGTIIDCGDCVRPDTLDLDIASISYSGTMTFGSLVTTLRSCDPCYTLGPGETEADCGPNGCDDPFIGCIPPWTGFFYDDGVGACYCEQTGATTSDAWISDWIDIGGGSWRIYLLECIAGTDPIQYRLISFDATESDPPFIRDCDGAVVGIASVPACDPMSLSYSSGDITIGEP